MTQLFQMHILRGRQRRVRGTPTYLDCSGRNPEYLQKSFSSFSFKTKSLREDIQGDFQNWNTCLSFPKQSHLSARKGECEGMNTTFPTTGSENSSEQSIAYSTALSKDLLPSGYLCLIWNLPEGQFGSPA